MRSVSFQKLTISLLLLVNFLSASFIFADEKVKLMEGPVSYNQFRPENLFQRLATNPSFRRRFYYNSDDLWPKEYAFCARGRNMLSELYLGPGTAWDMNIFGPAWESQINMLAWQLFLNKVDKASVLDFFPYSWPIYSNGQGKQLLIISDLRILFYSLQKGQALSKMDMTKMRQFSLSGRLQDIWEEIIYLCEESLQQKSSLSSKLLEKGLLLLSSYQLAFASKLLSQCLYYPIDFISQSNNWQNDFIKRLISGSPLQARQLCFFLCASLEKHSQKENSLFDFKKYSDFYVPHLSSSSRATGYKDYHYLNFKFVKSMYTDLKQKISRFDLFHDLPAKKADQVIFSIIKDYYPDPLLMEYINMKNSYPFYEEVRKKVSRMDDYQKIRENRARYLDYQYYKKLYKAYQRVSLIKSRMQYILEGDDEAMLQAALFIPESRLKEQRKLYKEYNWEIALKKLQYKKTMHVRINRNELEQKLINLIKEKKLPFLYAGFFYPATQYMFEALSAFTHAGLLKLVRDQRSGKEELWIFDRIHGRNRSIPMAKAGDVYLAEVFLPPQHYLKNQPEYSWFKVKIPSQFEFVPGQIIEEVSLLNIIYYFKDLLREKYPEYELGPGFFFSAMHWIFNHPENKKLFRDFSRLRFHKGLFYRSLREEKIKNGLKGKSIYLLARKKL